MNQLSDKVDLIPFCPEVAIGLSVPRAKIRVVRGKDKKNRVIGVENQGLYRTSDYGVTWDHRTSYPEDDIRKIFFKDDTYYVADWRGLFKTDNFGSTWSNIFYDCNEDITKLNNGRIYTSSDGGANWTERIYTAGYWDGIWYSDDEVNWIDTGLGDRATEVEATSNNDVFAFNNGAIKLLISGQTEWSSVLNISCYDIYIDENNVVFAGGNNNIQYCTFIGGAWNPINGTPTGNAINAVCKDENGYIYCGIGNEYNGTQFGLYKSNIPFEAFK